MNENEQDKDSELNTWRWRWIVREERRTWPRCPLFSAWWPVELVTLAWNGPVSGFVANGKFSIRTSHQFRFELARQNCKQKNRRNITWVTWLGVCVYVTFTHDQRIMPQNPIAYVLKVIVLHQDQLQRTDVYGALRDCTNRACHQVTCSNEPNTMKAMQCKYRNVKKTYNSRLSRITSSRTRIPQNNDKSVE